MSVHKEYELSCNGPRGWGPFDCPARLYGPTVAAVRGLSASRGWVTQYRDGLLIDLCPDHKAAPPPDRGHGECPVCGSSKRLTFAGLIWSHKTLLPSGRYSVWRCEGSGKQPAEKVEPSVPEVRDAGLAALVAASRPPKPTGIR